MAARSTYCYTNTDPIKLTRQEYNLKKTQWDLFEKVEDKNATVWQSILNQGGFYSGYSNGTNEPIFYTFKNDTEYINYKAGQNAHIREYPDVSGFLSPYSTRPLPIIDVPGSHECSKVDISKKISATRMLFNSKDLSSYSQISTYNAQFPRSPYKFKTNGEYLNYTKIKKFICN
jgi:hypothetical protein